MVFAFLVFFTDTSLSDSFFLTQVVLVLLVFLIDFGLSEVATCNPQNRECSCADTSSRVSVSFSYKSLKGGLSQFGDRLWSVISFLFLYIYPFNSIRSPNLGPAYLSISKDGGGGPLCLSEISWGWVPILFGKWLLVEWFTIFKTILEHWMPKNLQNNVWLLKLLVGRRGIWPSLKSWFLSGFMLHADKHLGVIDFRYLRGHGRVKIPGCRTNLPPFHHFWITCVIDPPHISFFSQK